MISAALLGLLADPGVERVWYGGDDFGRMSEVDAQFIDKMNRHWIKHANRPYRLGAMPEFPRS
jgi:hypothetical protein